MRRARRLAVALAAAAALAALAAGPAAAEFGPIRLVSKSAVAQAREASLPAISADGEYVAFQGVMDGGRQGVFEENLTSGQVVAVATGPAPERQNQPEPSATATAPSISADGRYVAFTTKAPLDPLDDPAPETESVYVADMGTSPPTYELASVEPGGTTAMTAPARAAAMVALDGDGREVAFVSEDQVYIRDLETRETTLVSVERDALTGAMEPGVPVAGGAVLPEAVISGQNGAAISADGTTVAWLGVDSPAQVPMSAEEAEEIDAADAGGEVWDEPLWRRIADGPTAPTRRIVGGGPLLPFAFDNEINKAIGWFTRAEGLGLVGVPRLSADGYTVGMVGSPTEAGNAYVASMRPGDEWARPLTMQVAIRPSEEFKVINREPNVPRNGHVWNLAISADGKRVAFTTARQEFRLAPPNLVTPPPSSVGLVELYEADLENGSLRRVTHGFAAAAEPSLPPAGGNALSGQGGNGATSPSFADEGRLIAFASEAFNLVAGDGNSAADVFLVEDSDAPHAAVSVAGTVPSTGQKRAHRLVLSAFSMADGRVRLVVVSPGKGRLRAQAAAKLGRRHKARQVGAGRAKAKAAKPVSIVLALPPKLRRLAGTREGVYANAQVWFKASSGGKLHAATPIHFHRHSKKKGRGTREARAPRPRARRRLPRRRARRGARRPDPPGAPGRRRHRHRVQRTGGDLLRRHGGNLYRAVRRRRRGRTDRDPRRRDRIGPLERLRRGHRRERLRGDDERGEGSAGDLRARLALGAADRAERPDPARRSRRHLLLGGRTAAR